MTDKKTILALEMDDYIRRHMGRRQQLMRALSQDYNVIYCDRMNSLIHELYHRKFKIFSELTTTIHVIHENLRYIRLPPVFLPFASSFRVVNKINCKIYDYLITRALRKLGIDKIDVKWVGHPFAVDCKINADIMIHDCFDDHAGFHGRIPQYKIEEIETDVMQESDHTLFSANALFEKKSSLCNSATVVRNGVDYEHFYLPPSESVRHDKTILYSGVIGHWVDLSIVDELSIGLPEYQIILIGPDRVDARSRFVSKKNVKVLGKIDYADLQKYYHAATVCIIPFDENIPLIKNTNPIKLYEYLASGKPVLSTSFEEVCLGEELVTVINREEVSEQVRQLVIRNSEAKVKLRQDYAKTHSWEERVVQVKRIISNLI